MSSRQGNVRRGARAARPPTLVEVAIAYAWFTRRSGTPLTLKGPVTRSSPSAGWRGGEGASCTSAAAIPAAPEVKGICCAETTHPKHPLYNCSIIPLLSLPHTRGELLKEDHALALEPPSQQDQHAARHDA